MQHGGLGGAEPVGSREGVECCCQDCTAVVVQGCLGRRQGQELQDSSVCVFNFSQAVNCAFKEVVCSYFRAGISSQCVTVAPAQLLANKCFGASFLIFFGSLGLQ